MECAAEMTFNDRETLFFEPKDTIDEKSLRETLRGFHRSIATTMA
jgi:hypothetical protein